MKEKKDLVEITKAYYDSQDADHFYHTIWGGEDIHVGIYQFPEEDIFTASNRTVQQMLSTLKWVDKDTKILDLGAGYGGAARYIASKFRCHITCLNLSQVENQRNREKNELLGLTAHIDVVQGNFEAVPFDESQFDIIWSEDAILHSRNKPQVFEEVARVLKPGGHFIFTDPMQSDDCPNGVLQPILDRIHLEELGSVRKYKRLATQVGLKEVKIIEMPDQLTNHYTQVQKELISQKGKLEKICSPTYIEKMDKGLSHWIQGGQKGYLNWGILMFQK
ncbi:MAG: methyltransferase domain-containing protein [Saprospiraceae bacterium]|nr:methyltransferase domain-containing protein [Saprospiraceae bacterium]